MYHLQIANRTGMGLNGVQAVVTLPRSASFAGSTSDTVTLQGSEVVITVGRLADGGAFATDIPIILGGPQARGVVKAIVRSSTAQPVFSNEADALVR